MKEALLNNIGTNSKTPYYGFIDEEIESEHDHRKLFALRRKRLEMQLNERVKIKELNRLNKGKEYTVQKYVNLFTLDNTNPSPKIKTPKIIKKSKKSPNPKEKVTRVENIAPDELKTIALDAILKKMPFNLYDECISNKRSAKYYITKPKLIEIIDTLDDLKQRMPKNYKKLAKEDICLEIYK